MPDRHSAVSALDQSETRPDKKSRLDLSAVQVFGGALAAMTAASLGSRLSVEGTIVGAALASVVAAVGGALYTASLRRTSAVVHGVLGGRRTPGAATTAGPAAEPSGATAAPEPPSGAARTSRRRTLVLSSVVGAVAIFALAGVSLTLYEAIAGQAISGGGGTTFSQVREGGSADRPAEEKPAAPDDSAEPSESAEPDPTAEPSETPPAETEPTAEPTPEPPAEPSAEPSATAESQPSAPAAPPSEAPDQSAPTPG